MAGDGSIPRIKGTRGYGVRVTTPISPLPLWLDSFDELSVPSPSRFLAGVSLRRRTLATSLEPQLVYLALPLSQYRDFFTFGLVRCCLGFMFFLYP
jgi:hypothetical protein